MAVELTTARYGHGLLGCVMRALEGLSMYKRFREFAVWFAMEHFQLRKPRNKSWAESRGLTSEAGRALACARYREVSGKSWARSANHFQQKKMPYMPDFGNSRRGHASSTRRTFVLFGKSHLPIALPKSRQNSPEGLVYGNSNATTALANSRLVIPALWALATHILHRAFVTIFTSNAIAKDSEQGFD